MMWMKRLIHNIYLRWDWCAIWEVVKYSIKIILIVAVLVALAFGVWYIINPIPEDPSNFESDLGFYGEIIYTEEHKDYMIEYRRCIVTDQVLMMYRESGMYNTAVTMCYIIDPNTGYPMTYETFMGLVESRGEIAP